ncbi:c-type cytochrome [Paracoccus sp. (in: a-proteobacteria)]
MADTGLIAAACVVVMSVGLAATFAPSYRSPPAPSPAVDTAASAAAAAPAPAPPVSPARQAELEHMVIQDCGSCHGLTMKGGLGKPITPGDLAGFDPEGLAAIILDGVPGTAMPPWRPLISEPEALWIAEYLMKEKTE